MDDLECFHVSRGHPSRREANWERRESSVSDSVALDTVGRAPPLPAWQSDRRERAMLSRQDAVSSSSNTDSTPHLQSPADGCASPPWLLSPGVATSPALSPLWTGSGLPPPPSWTLRSPGLRPVATVQRSVSSASSRSKPAYAGWTYDKAPAATRQTANSQPTVSTQRQMFRPRAQRPGDWIMHHARIKPKTRPHQLPGLRRHEVDKVARRAATNSDNSLSSSDSDGRYRTKSRDSQVLVTMTTDCKQQSQFLIVDSTDEVRISDSYPQLRLAPSPQICHEPSAATVSDDVNNENNITMQSLSVPTSSVHEEPSVATVSDDVNNENNITMQSLSVPTSSVRRRSVSLALTSSAFSKSFDDDDTQ